MDLSYVPVKYSRTKLDYLDSLKGNFKVTRSFYAHILIVCKTCKRKAHTHKQNKLIFIIRNHFAGRTPLGRKTSHDRTVFARLLY